MVEQKSFKERVKEPVIQCAGLYKSYYVDYEYLICSSAFVKNAYYIISSHEDNYLHLTGVHTNLDAATFLKNVTMELYKRASLDFVKKGRVKKR